MIKSFAIPHILYKVTLISRSKEFTRKIDTLLFSFIWKGKDKVKHTVWINSIDKGGLKMPDIGLMISTRRVPYIKRYLPQEPAVWNFFFFDFHLKNVRGKFLFHCNFSYPQLQIALPEFYKECLEVQSSLGKANPLSVSEIIWNNNCFLCIDSKSIFNQRLINLRIC